MREPLRHRQFRRFFLAQGATLFGDAIFLVAIAFAVLDVTDSARALGIVFAAGTGTIVACILFSGVIVDRVSRLRVMIASDLTRMVAQGVLALLLFTDRADLWSLIVLYVIFSAATSFFQPARAGMVQQLLDPAHLTAGNALLATARNVVSIAGWAAGGALVALLGPAGAIALDAATFAVSAMLLASMGTLAPHAREAARPFLRELGEGWHEVTSRPWLWKVIACASLWLLVYEAPLQVLGPLVMREDYHGAASWGLFGASLAAGAVLGAIGITRRVVRRPMLTTLLLFFATAGMPLLFLAEPPLAVLCVGAVVVGLSFGAFDTVWESAVQKLVPPSRIARVSSWDWMGSLACTPLGFALAGFGSEAFGLDVMLVAMAGATFAVCLLLVSQREVRELDGLVAAADATRRVVDHPKD